MKISKIENNLIATSDFSKMIDNYCIDILEFPEIILMENAAIGAFEEIVGLGQSFNIIVSTGNNGGDGFAIARHLFSHGKDVKIFLMGNTDKFSYAGRTNYEICKNLAVSIDKIEDVDQYLLKNEIEIKEITVDCIFGTGLSREIQGEYYKIISLINNKKFGDYIVSIDTPSGLNASTGEVMGISVKADMTISFEFFKKGFLSYSAQDYLGEVRVKTLNIPKFVSNNLANDWKFLDKTIAKHIIKRSRNDHKGTYGRAVLFAGSEKMPGAGKICSKAAVKTGSGLVTCITDSEAVRILASDAFEYMVADWAEKDRLNELINSASAIGFGPGLGRNKKTIEMLKYLLKFANVPLIIDADGIWALKNILKDHRDLFDSYGQKIVITPHPGELAMFLGVPSEEINNWRIDYAIKTLEKYDLICLLKGKDTIVGQRYNEGYKIRVNTTGNSKMANGGMGDCLLGICTSLIAMKIPIYESICLAVYLHGLAADILAKKLYTVTATDIINILPGLMEEQFNNFVNR